MMEPFAMLYATENWNFVLRRAKDYLLLFAKKM